MADTEERVRKILCEHLNVDAERVVPPARIMDDLGADSLDQVELLMACEEEFNIEVPDDEAEEIATVADLIAYIDKKRA